MRYFLPRGLATPRLCELGGLTGQNECMLIFSGRADGYLQV